MNLDNITPDAIRSLDIAIQNARERHNLYVDVEHLLLGSIDTDFVKRLVGGSTFDLDRLGEALNKALSIKREEALKVSEIKGLTQDARATISRAQDIARNMNVLHLNSGHLLLSILMEPSPFLADILQPLAPIDTESLRQTLAQQSAEPSSNFQQRWNPNQWENGRILMQTGAVETAARVRFQSKPPNARTPARPNNQADNSTQTQILIGVAIIAAVLYGAAIAPTATIAVVIVLGGWIISLILHEFSHAVVGYFGGDYGVAERGYLSLNPFKYTHPLLSIGLPLMFLALGGIGLPGGAVYIDRSALRNKYWGSLVSAAGPFANLVCLIIFSAPFWSGYVTLERYFEAQTQWGALAFLVFLQATAILLNLVPIPPLDGFGIIEPFLPDDIAAQVRSFGSIGLFLIILMFWLPSEEAAFNPARQLFEEAENITYDLGGVTPGMPGDGYDAFRFWD